MEQAWQTSLTRGKAKNKPSEQQKARLHPANKAM
jgi:hypothetical protein